MEASNAGGVGRNRDSEPISISRSRVPSSYKQSRRDQDVQRTSKRCR